MESAVQAYGVAGVGEAFKGESRTLGTWATHTFLCTWIPVPAGEEVLQELSGGWRKEMGTEPPVAECWLSCYVSAFL